MFQKSTKCSQKISASRKYTNQLIFHGNPNFVGNFLGNSMFLESLLRFFGFRFAGVCKREAEAQRNPNKIPK
jgi:hypothetical protein